MTNQELVRLFLIEYDKVFIAGYPSFTDSEIEFWLNKAYLEIISQKITGTNSRRIPAEGDLKNVSDIQPLITTYIGQLTTVDSTIKNKFIVGKGADEIPENMLYMLSGYISYDKTFGGRKVYATSYVPHIMEHKLAWTSNNKPWLRTPVLTMQDGLFVVFLDPDDAESVQPGNIQFKITYVSSPEKVTLTEPTAKIVVNDNVCYEIISRAVVLALENIESPRTASKAQLTTLSE